MFDLHFCEPLSDAYKCEICCMVLYRPMQTCGFRYCEACILKYRRENQACCPFHKNPIEKTDDNLHFDACAKREISQLLVRCGFDHCSWIGTFEKLEEHLDECEFALVECPKQCGERLSKKKLEYHLQNECSKRIVACRYCGVKLIAARAPDHYETCMKVIVPCPKGCNQADIMRENLQYHYEQECTKAKPKCLFRENGCTFEGTNKDIEKHLSESLQQHLLLLARENRSLKRDNSEQKEIVNEVLSVFNSRSEYMRQLVKDVTNMIADLKSKISDRDVPVFLYPNGPRVRLWISNPESTRNSPLYGNWKPEMNSPHNGNWKPELNLPRNGNWQPELNSPRNGNWQPEMNSPHNGNWQPELNSPQNGNWQPELNSPHNGNWKPEIN